METATVFTVLAIILTDRLLRVVTLVAMREYRRRRHLPDPAGWQRWWRDVRGLPAHVQEHYATVKLAELREADRA